MRTDKIRKYLIPNIPYLFILWAFLKLGTAYRLAAGNDFAHKLIGLGQTIGPAFADFAPGLAPLDWLVGIVGAVGFRLLIYFKSKNAKKFRRDERDRKGSIQTTQEVEIYFNFVGRFVPPAFGEVELTPEELEEIRKREERKDRLHQNYLKRKANGKQKEYEERTKAKKKAEIEARKQAIRTEDIARGVFIPVSSLPQLGPRKGA